MPLTRRQYKEQQELWARDRLRSLAPAGTTVYTIPLASSSRIRVFIIVMGAPVDISHEVSIVLGRRRNASDGGIVVPGYGFNKEHDIVDALSYSLYGESANSRSTSNGLAWSSFR